MTIRHFSGETTGSATSSRSQASRVVLTALWWAVVVFLTLFAAVLGSVVGVTLAIAASAMSFVLFRPGSLSRFMGEPMLVMFALGFVGIALVFALTADQPADFRFAFNYVAFVLAAPVFLFSCEIAGKRTVVAVLWLSLAGVTVAAGWGIADIVLFDSTRAAGAYGSLIYARHAILLGIVAGAGVFLIEGWPRFLFCLGPIMGIIAILISQARGVLLAAPVIMLVYLVMIWFARDLPGRRWVVGTIVAGAIAAFFLSVDLIDPARIFGLIDLLWNALTGVDSGDPGTEIRLVLWSAAVQAFLDAPLIGHGWVGAQAIAAEAVGPEQAAVLYVQFHNDLGNFAVSAGLVGIAAYLLFLLGPIAGVLRSPADSFASGRAFAVCGIVLLYAVSGLTDITFGYDLPTVAYALMVALVLGSFRTRN